MATTDYSERPILVTRVTVPILIAIAAAVSAVGGSTAFMGRLGSIDSRLSSIESKLSVPTVTVAEFNAAAVLFEFMNEEAGIKMPRIQR